MRPGIWWKSAGRTSFVCPGCRGFWLRGWALTLIAARLGVARAVGGQTSVTAGTIMQSQPPAACRSWFLGRAHPWRATPTDTTRRCSFRHSWASAATRTGLVASAERLRRAMVDPERDLLQDLVRDRRDRDTPSARTAIPSTAPRAEEAPSARSSSSVRSSCRRTRQPPPDPPRATSQRSRGTLHAFIGRHGRAGRAHRHARLAGLRGTRTANTNEARVVEGEEKGTSYLHTGSTALLELQAYGRTAPFTASGNATSSATSTSSSSAEPADAHLQRRLRQGCSGSVSISRQATISRFRRAARLSRNIGPAPATTKTVAAFFTPRSSARNQAPRVAPENQHVEKTGFRGIRPFLCDLYGSSLISEGVPVRWRVASPSTRSMGVRAVQH